jgi:type I restriction enzyme S subunit
MGETWELPDGWTWARFDDVAKVVSDLVDPANYQGVPHIAPNHIESATGRLLEYATVAQDGVTSPKHRFHPGQILYSKIRPYLAKAVLVDFAGVCSADMYPVSTSLDARYLHKWLISSAFTEWASRRQGRTVLPKINQDALGALPVPVPPPAEQRRIVARIEALQARTRKAREAIEGVPALLEQYRQSVLAAAFRGDLTAEWRASHPDVEPASALLDRIRQEHRRRWESAELARMKSRPRDNRWKARYQEPEPVDDTDLPEPPEGWCWAAAEEIVEPSAEIVYGIVQPGPRIPDGVLYVRGNDIQDGRILVDQLWRTSPEIAKRYDRASLRGGDVLLGIIRATKVAIVPPELDGGNITQGTARFRPSDVIATDFLAGWLESAFAQDWLHQHYRGIDMPGLNLRDVRRLPVPLAPLEEQATIAARLTVEKTRQEKSRLAVADAAAQLAQLDQAILAKAFRGELVPQDPDDEPASALLERIRAERSSSNGATPKQARQQRLAGID